MKEFEHAWARIVAGGRSGRRRHRSGVDGAGIRHFVVPGEAVMNQPETNTPETGNSGRKLPLTTAALMSVAAIIAIFAAGPAPAGQEAVPVFLIGTDDGLSPFVMRRDSEEFKEVVFPPVARAMARNGLRAIGEEPFRARFSVDGVPGERLSRWESDDFLHYAGQVPVDDAGNTAQYIVFLNIWRRVCRDDATALCLDIGSDVHETASGERLFGPGPDVRIPIPHDCKGDCIWSFWHAHAEALFHSLGAEIAALISQRLLEGTARTAGEARTIAEDGRRPTAVVEMEIGADTDTPIAEVWALARRICGHNEVWTEPWAFGRTCMVGPVNREGSGSDECHVEAYTYICVEP